MAGRFGDDTFGFGTFGGVTLPRYPNITYTIEVDFTTALLGVPVAWTDITDYVRSFSTRRGRNHELGKMQAGEASLTLDNRDRRFDPTNTASPYYPNVLPMRHCRISAATTATYVLFRGFVEDWGQQWSGPNAAGQGDATAEVHLVDAFSVLNRTDITSYPTEVMADAPLIYLPFDDLASSATYANQGDADFVLSSSPDAPTLGVGDGPLSGGAAALTTTTATGYATTHADVEVRKRVGHDWTFEAWVKRGPGASFVDLMKIESPTRVWLQVRLNASHKIDLLQTSDTGSTVTYPFAFHTLGTSWQHVAVVRTGRFAELYLNGVPVESTSGLVGGGDTFATADTLVSVISNDPGTAIAHVAVYDHALDDARIAEHYAAKMGKVAGGQTVDAAIAGVLGAIGWPSYSLGVSSHTVSTHLPDPNALNELQTLAEDTDGGSLFVAANGTLTFRSSADLRRDVASAASWGDTTAELRYSGLTLRYDDQDLFTEVRANADGLVDALASDPTAAVTYGPRSLGSSGGVLADANQLTDRATGYLSRYKTPAVRPETLLAVDSPSQTTRADEMFASEIGRRVTATRRPPGGGSPMVMACVVEGVSHSPVEQMAQMRTTLNLVPVLDPTPWILADATNGVLGSTTDLGW